jgi:hypothetical protein
MVLPAYVSVSMSISMVLPAYVSVSMIFLWYYQHMFLKTYAGNTMEILIDTETYAGNTIEILIDTETCW